MGRSYLLLSITPNRCLRYSADKQHTKPQDDDGMVSKCYKPAIICDVGIEGMRGQVPFF